MEAEVKQIIKEKEYVHDENRKEYASKGVGNAALATGIIGTALGAAAIWGRGRGGFGFGGNMPENVNINTVSDAIAGRNGAAPTAFGAYSHSCEAQLALTNEMWGLKMNTLNLMYQHRDTDVAIDMFVDMFKEMDIQEYKIGMIPITVGKGEIVAELPHNPLLDMVVGNLGKVKITSADFLELKELFTT